MSWLWVAAGGALGALLRYGATGWVQEWTASPFPWGTMTVNVLGSLVLGFAVVWLEAAATSPAVRQFGTIGLLGAFTTFSTFSVEALALLRDGDWPAAGGYVLGSVAAGIAAAVIGFALAAWLLSSRG